MPGRADEELWTRAEKAVLPHRSRYRQPYAVVEYVYKKMLAAKRRGEHVCQVCVRKMARARRDRP